MGSKLELQLGKLKFIVGIGGSIMSFNESAQEKGQTSSNTVCFTVFLLAFLYQSEQCLKNSRTRGGCPLLKLQWRPNQFI